MLVLLSRTQGTSTSRWWCALGNVATRERVEDHDLIMFDHQFAGSVLINGQPRRLNINDNPMGRTIIQVDGVTVYDEGRFQNDVIDFQIIPGKVATMRWQRVLLLKIGCDIFVDNKSTTLPSVAKDGTARPLLDAQARKKLEMRMLGAGSLAFAAFSFWLNRIELMSAGEYYPPTLWIIPAFVLLGIVFLVKPELLNFSPKNKVMLWGTIVAILLTLVFGCTIFAA